MATPPTSAAEFLTKLPQLYTDGVTVTQITQSIAVFMPTDGYSLDTTQATADVNTFKDYIGLRARAYQAWFDAAVSLQNNQLMIDMLQANQKGTLASVGVAQANVQRLRLVLYNLLAQQLSLYNLARKALRKQVHQANYVALAAVAMPSAQATNAFTILRSQQDVTEQANLAQAAAANGTTSCWASYSYILPPSVEGASDPRQGLKGNHGIDIVVKPTYKGESQFWGCKVKAVRAYFLTGAGPDPRHSVEGLGASVSVTAVSNGSSSYTLEDGSQSIFLPGITMEQGVIFPFEYNPTSFCPKSDVLPPKFQPSPFGSWNVGCQGMECHSAGSSWDSLTEVRLEFLLDFHQRATNKTAGPIFAANGLQGAAVSGDLCVIPLASSHRYAPAPSPEEDTGHAMMVVVACMAVVACAGAAAYRYLSSIAPAADQRLAKGATPEVGYVAAWRDQADEEGYVLRRKSTIQEGMASTLPARRQTCA